MISRIYFNIICWFRWFRRRCNIFYNNSVHYCGALSTKCHQYWFSRSFLATFHCCLSQCAVVLLLFGWLFRILSVAAVENLMAARWWLVCYYKILYCWFVSLISSWTLKSRLYKLSMSAELNTLNWLRCHCRYSSPTPTVWSLWPLSFVGTFISETIRRNLVSTKQHFGSLGLPISLAVCRSWMDSPLIWRGAL